MRKVVHPQTDMGTKLPAGPFHRPLFCDLAGQVGLFAGKSTLNAPARQTRISNPEFLTSNQPKAIIICSHFIIVMTFFFFSRAFQQILKAAFKRQLSVQSGGECGIAAAWGDVAL